MSEADGEHEEREAAHSIEQGGTMNLLSIVMPVYNEDRWVTEIVHRVMFGERLPG